MYLRWRYRPGFYSAEFEMSFERLLEVRELRNRGIACLGLQGTRKNPGVFWKKAHAEKVAQDLSPPVCHTRKLGAKNNPIAKKIHANVGPKEEQARLDLHHTTRH